MARSGPEAAVTLSVLDRLIDEEPRVSGEAPLSRAQAVRTLKAAVRRDLEWLLNTRRIVEEPADNYKELNRSAYIFGLPDFSSMSIRSASDRDRLLRTVEEAIELFEPRLANVQLIPVEGEEKSIQTLRFRIDALLLMDPAPEQVFFDTVLQLTSQQYKIKGDSDA